MNTIAAGAKDTTAARFRRELSAKRVIIGFVVAGVGLASIANDIAFAIVIGIIAVAGAVEFANLARRAGGEVAGPVAVAGCAAGSGGAAAGLCPASRARGGRKGHGDRHIPGRPAESLPHGQCRRKGAKAL